MSTSLKSHLPFPPPLLHHSFSPLYSPSMKCPTPFLTPSTPSTTCQEQSNRRAGWEWWAWSEKPPGRLTRTATTRWICRLPAYCWWSKMDVSGIPLDRKSKKCQRSHGEWIVLNHSGNVISSPPVRKIFLLLTNVAEWLKWVFARLLRILTLAALVSSFWSIKRIGRTFNCSLFKVMHLANLTASIFQMLQPTQSFLISEAC